MVKVFLYGHLERFGKQFNLAIYNTPDAIRCLSTQIKGFREDFLNGSYRVIRRTSKDEELEMDTLRINLPPNAELHIIPAVAGAGRGAGKIILGAVLIAAAYVAAPPVIGIVGVESYGGLSATAIGALGITYSQIAGFGLAMVLGGVVQMLTATSMNSNTNAVEENASTLFNGATNTSIQGCARPLLYGRFCAGSIVGSSALAVEEYT